MTLTKLIKIIVAVYQALSLKYPDNEFIDRFSFFVYGCLTPIIVRSVLSLLTGSKKEAVMMTRFPTGYISHSDHLPCRTKPLSPGGGFRGRR